MISFFKKLKKSKVEFKPTISKKESYKLLFEQMAMKNAYEKKLLQLRNKKKCPSKS